MRLIALLLIGVCAVSYLIASIEEYLDLRGVGAIAFRIVLAVASTTAMTIAFGTVNLPEIAREWIR